MPGMLSPCWQLIGLSIAPEPLSSTRLSSPRCHALHQPAAADRGDAPAAAAAGVGILFLKEHARAAVDQLFIGHVGFVAVEQLHQDVPPDPAEIACGDQVVIGGGAAEVG